MIIRANASLMIFFFISANIKFSVSPPPSAYCLIHPWRYTCHSIINGAHSLSPPFGLFSFTLSQSCHFIKNHNIVFALIRNHPGDLIPIHPPVPFPMKNSLQKSSPISAAFLSYRRAFTASVMSPSAVPYRRLRDRTTVS